MYLANLATIKDNLTSLAKHPAPGCAEKVEDSLLLIQEKTLCGQIQAPDHLFRIDMAEPATCPSGLLAVVWKPFIVL